MIKSLAILPLALVAVLPFQERIKPGANKPKFDETLKAVEASWNAENYGDCVKKLQALTTLAMEKHAEAIRAALPAAPAGYEMVPKKKEANPFAGALMSTVGNLIEARYRKSGSGEISVEVMANSPMVQMLGMMFSNPAMLEEGSELVKYNAHTAILKTSGSRLELQILIHEAHVVTVRWPDADADALFAMWNQAAVDKLAGVLGTK